MTTLAPNPNPGRPPTGGKWQYTTEGITLSADDFPSLAEKAAVILIRRLLTRPEIEQMVLAQEKKRCPWLVSEVAGEIEIPRHQVAFREYVKRLGNSEYLDQNDFEKRAAICRACPHNIPIEIDEEAERLLYLLTRGKDTFGLGWCDFTGQANAVACMVEKRQTLVDDEHGPKVCWLRPGQDPAAVS